MLALPHLLVLLAAAVSLAGSAAYIRDTLAGKTMPNRVTWSMWALASLVAAGASLSAGADPWATVRIFAAGLGPLIVFGVSFLNPRGFWKMDAFDAGCGVFSVLALAAWLVADAPRAAVLLAIAGDVSASLPTIRKAWAAPETETGAAFALYIASSLLALPAIPVWNLENASFQAYLLGVNGVILLGIYRKRIVSPLLLMRSS